LSVVEILIIIIMHIIILNASIILALGRMHLSYHARGLALLWNSINVRVMYEYWY